MRIGSVLDGHCRQRVPAGMPGRASARRRLDDMPVGGRRGTGHGDEAVGIEFRLDERLAAVAGERESLAETGNRKAELLAATAAAAALSLSTPRTDAPAPDRRRNTSRRRRSPLRSSARAASTAWRASSRVHTACSQQVEIDRPCRSRLPVAGHGEGEARFAASCSGAVPSQSSASLPKYGRGHAGEHAATP